MGLLLLRRITSLCILSWFATLALADISELSPARMTDLVLREYAFKAVSNSTTGVIYDGQVPANLTGIKVSALRLRSGSFRINGLTFKEFQIPAGVKVYPYVERFTLVYQNLGNWSSQFYELDEYIHLTPVLGLLAYKASDVSDTSSPELDFRASEDPISVKFADTKPAPEGSSPMCVAFDLYGLVRFTKVISGNTCLTYDQGHYSIVIASIESTAPDAQPETSSHEGSERTNGSTEMIVVCSAVGGLIMVMLLSFLIFCVLNLDSQKKIRVMEKAAEVGESLQMTCLSTSKAPTAPQTRTQPTLESERAS